MAKPKAGGRLRNPTPERDAAADDRARSAHVGMAKGFTGGLLERLREFLTDPQEGTRIHKDDVRQMKHLIQEFETEMRELFKEMRVQQHGVRDMSLDDPTGADLTNVISFKDRAAGLQS